MMGAGSSCSESRPATETSLSAEEPAAQDVASSSDWSVGEEASSATFESLATPAPTQTQQRANTDRKTESEKEKMRREKEEKQKQAYLELSVDDVWLKVAETVDANPQPLKQESQRTGWHTVRIFVSSTFRDFHTERDVLVKKVHIILRVFLNFKIACDKCDKKPSCR